MAEIHDVIVRPIVTEKGTRLTSSQNTYVFEVAENANKHEIQVAVEQLFGVKVVDVRTLRVRGKSKRFGRHSGKRPNWKKAYVKLADGNVLNFFES
jgi:large subunit ribosomal protein L23